MSTRSSLLVVAVLGFGQLVAFASSFYLLGVMADPIARGLGAQPSLLFAALSGAFVISAVAGPAAGRWIDRRGGREALVASNLIFAVALVTISAAWAPAVAAGGVVLLGAGMTIGLYGTPFAILVALYGDAARRPITAVSLIGAFGGALGWPTSLWLAEAFGWRAACAAWAAIHLLVCLPLTVAFVPAARPVHDAANGDPPIIRWDRRMTQLAALFAGAWVISTAMGAHLPRLLAKLGLGAAEAAIVAGLTASAAIGVRLLDLSGLSRLSPLASVRLAALMHPLGAAITLAGGARWAAALTVGQGIGNGLLSVASGVLPLAVFGREGYATRQALLLTPARFLQAAGPAAYGLVVDRSASLALILSSAVCLGMFAVTFGLGGCRDQVDV